MTRIKQSLQWLRCHAHPNIVVPVVVAAGLIAYVASLASTPDAARALALVMRRIWWIVLLLTIPYLIARAYVWNDLLRELGLAIPLRRLLVAFAAGEMAKSFPAGVYVENYLLDRVSHLDKEQTVRSTVATTAILGLECALALAVVLIVGIPGAAWVRWGLIAIVGAWIAIIGAGWLLIRRELHTHPALPHWLRQALGAAEAFLDDGRALFRRRTLTNIVPTAIYMGIYAVDLFFVLEVMGFHLGWVDTITVYAAMVLAVVLVPIPTEIGIAEISALGALEAFGVPHHSAAVASLALRILATGSTILLAGLVFVALRGEIKKADDEEDDDAQASATGREPDDEQEPSHEDIEDSIQGGDGWLRLR